MDYSLHILIYDDRACAHMQILERMAIHIIVTHLDTLNRWTAVPQQPQGDHPLGRVWFLGIFSSFTHSHSVLRKVKVKGPEPAETERRSETIIPNPTDAKMSGHDSVQHLKPWLCVIVC